MIMTKIKSFFGSQDLTKGRPMVGLIKFSIPLLIGNFAQQMYSTVDAVVVGKYVGDGALAAVGVSFPVLMLLLVLFMGISTGASIMASQYFGAKQKENLSRTIGTCIVLTFYASILMTVVGYFCSAPIINLLNTPPEIRDMSIAYLQIIFIGIIGGGYFNIISGVLRGMGDSVYPLIFLIIASILNIFLDLLFVTQFGMGVPGVAWATIISQAISAILCLLRLRSMKEVLTINRETVRLDKPMAIKLAKLGLPASITQIIFALSGIMVQSLANTLGKEVIAATTVVMRVDGFAMMPNFTFGMATATYVGQNIGAKRMDRVVQGTKDSLKMGFIVSVFLTVCLLLFGEYLMQMFTQTESLIALGVRMIRILAVGYIAFAGSQILQGVLRGAGETMIPMWISIFCTVILRMPLAYILAWMTRSPQFPNGSPDCLFISLLVSWVVGLLLTFVVYKKGSWKDKAVVR